MCSVLGVVSFSSYFFLGCHGYMDTASWAECRPRTPEALGLIPSTVKGDGGATRASGLSSVSWGLPSQNNRRKPALSSFSLLGFVVPETIHPTFYLELKVTASAFLRTGSSWQRVSVGPARASAFPAFSLDANSGMCLFWKY